MPAPLLRLSFFPPLTLNSPFMERPDLPFCHSNPSLVRPCPEPFSPFFVIWDPKAPFHDASYLSFFSPLIFFQAGLIVSPIYRYPPRHQAIVVLSSYLVLTQFDVVANTSYLGFPYFLCIPLTSFFCPLLCHLLPFFYHSPFELASWIPINISRLAWSPCFPCCLDPYLVTMSGGQVFSRGTFLYFVSYLKLYPLSHSR